MLARAFGVESARVEAPDDLPRRLQTALAANRPYLLEVVTRGDVPMPRTGLLGHRGLSSRTVTTIATELLIGLN